VASLFGAHRVAAPSVLSEPAYLSRQAIRPDFDRNRFSPGDWPCRGRSPNEDPAHEKRWKSSSGRHGAVPFALPQIRLFQPTEVELVCFRRVVERARRLNASYDLLHEPAVDAFLLDTLSKIGYRTRPGHLILAADYAAIELRIAAALAERSRRMATMLMMTPATRAMATLDDEGGAGAAGPAPLILRREHDGQNAEVRARSAVFLAGRAAFFGGSVTHCRSQNWYPCLA
jgi:hypothetical protein